ncbi:MAG TPA: PLP-dependent aminotransferase family protein [Thermoanaerobaculia bacterium]|nr:PLP-dependent aminotransferase family protein [Thermoanaerobaculia bacterium]
MQFLIPLAARGEPLFRQIYAGLRRAVLAGKVRAGERLPSTRDLAEQLGVSRTVAVLAYEQLVAEGFAVGRVGSGTFVPSELVASRPGGARRSARLKLSRYGSFAASTGRSIVFPEPRRSPLPFDFAYGRSVVDCFPFDQWQRILHRRARKIRVRELDYGPAEGTESLREAISTHLRRSRAVVCDASQVVVVNGSQQALDLIARVLIEPGEGVAIEDPLYQGTREVLRAAGARVWAVAVDREGLDPDSLPDTARIAFVTPSHQYPSGAVLPLQRRQKLLRWAGRRNSVIVEDDYDGEFRYDGKPLESLQGLDTEGRVLYVGTFSRTIFSALRIGYLVLPKSLVPAFSAAKFLCDRHTATLEQETLAEFIRTGMYERHLRRVRRRNAASRRALLEALREHMGDRIEVTGDGAGAHVVVWPRKRTSEEAAVAAAAARGVGVYGIGPYFFKRPSRPGLILGYPRLREADIREGVRRLAEVL